MLDGGVRVVLEVDGRQHYAVCDGGPPERYIANAERYAAMAAEDRRLRLMGYDVYRFGGHDFLDVNLRKRKVGERAHECVSDFFDRLLAKHGVR